MEELRRRMDSVFNEYDAPTYQSQYESTWPTVNLYDNGESLIVYAAVPGLKERDLNVNVQDDVVTITGERQSMAPEGYTVHRQERPSIKFTRSFHIPVKVDFNKTVATLKDGILTMMLPKSPEAQPKRITIKAG